MESRVAVLENDVRNIKDNVARLHDGMAAANSAITQLLTGQAQLRGDIDGLRKELKGDIVGLRMELKGDVDGLRMELKGDVDGLRKELKGDIVGLRMELKGDVDSLRMELKGDIVGLRMELKGDVDSLREELKGAINTLDANVGTVRAEMETLQARLIGRMEAQEKKIQRWFFATSLSCAGLAFTAVRLFH
jgi:chromosome segregation ATPase